jgi:hypothetical protein
MPRYSCAWRPCCAYTGRLPEKRGCEGEQEVRMDNEWLRFARSGGENGIKNQEGIMLINSRARIT